MQLKKLRVKTFLLLAVLQFSYAAVFAQEQKLISDCTVTYSVTETQNGKQNNIGSKAIYIKGKNLRTDTKSNAFNQTVFYNGSTGEATVLKNIGESKYISIYKADEWEKENEMYNDVSVSFTNDTKNILTYNCKKAVIKFKNGTVYNVYYTSQLEPSVMEKPFEVKNIPGLVLEYESSVKEDETITYTAQKVDITPVPSLMFDIPKTGYRILH